MSSETKCDQEEDVITRRAGHTYEGRLDAYGHMAHWDSQRGLSVLHDIHGRAGFGVFVSTGPDIWRASEHWLGALMDRCSWIARDW